MNILAIESSCDETGRCGGCGTAGPCCPTVWPLRSRCTLSTAAWCPEIASRKHVEAIAALTDQALRQAGCEKSDIDAVAVTYAPGSSARCWWA